MSFSPETPFPQLFRAIKASNEDLCTTIPDTNWIKFLQTMNEDTEHVVRMYQWLTSQLIQDVDNLTQSKKVLEKKNI